MSKPQHRGRIITFYSYKGGTGRSMLLANVAWILASAGRRVLVVDWDLEAPGLHRYFHPFLADAELTSTEGLIDFFTDYVVHALTPATPGELTRVFRPDIARYGVSIEYGAFTGGGAIDLVPAGKQGPAYSSRVNSFGWADFYGRLGGHSFLDAVKDTMRLDYDYVLIDSRTGVSDTSGICTVDMPDTLVVCFTLNTQSIEGAAAVTDSVSAQRTIDVYPVPCRVELAEKDRLEQKRDHYRRRFDSALGPTAQDDHDAYWGQVEVLYQPYYAYEEVLATFADRPNQVASLLAPMERVTAFITAGDVSKAVAPPAAVRARVVAKFARLEPTDAEKRTADELERALVATERQVEQLSTAQTGSSRSGTSSRPPGGFGWRAYVVIAAVMAAIAVVTTAIVRQPLLDSPSTTSVTSTPDTTDEPSVTATRPATTGGRPRTAPIVGPRTVDFGTIPVGTVSSATVTLLNSDPDFPLVVTSLGARGPTVFATGGDDCRSRRIEPRTACTIRVVFAPVTPGAMTGSLTVLTNALTPAAGSVTVQLVGTGA